MTGSAVAPANDGDIKALVTALEKRALELWNGGNPDGFIELSMTVCFDPTLESKLGGKKALAAYYDMIRGKIGIDSYRIVNPDVQPASDAAVLTCDYGAHRDGRLLRMHCIEVYRRNSSGRWEIMHTHWSFVPPEE